MVSHQSIAAATLLLIAGAQAQNQLVMSLANQIVSGLVDARKSGVPESKASSECNDIMTALMKDKNISGMLDKAANMVISGVNSDGFTSFVSDAMKSFSNFEGSDDFKTVDALISKNVKDLDTDKALPSVSSAISPALDLILPTISQMSKTDKNVAKAANTGIDLGKSVMNTLHLIPGSGGETGSANKNKGKNTSSPSVTSGATSTGSAASAAAATKSSGSSSSATSSASASSSTASEGGAQRNTVAGIAMGGLAAGAALLL